MGVLWYWNHPSNAPAPTDPSLSPPPAPVRDSYLTPPAAPVRDSYLTPPDAPIRDSYVRRNIFGDTVPIVNPI